MHERHSEIFYPKRDIMENIGPPKENIASLVVTAVILILIIIAATDPATVSHVSACWGGKSLCSKLVVN